MASKQGWGTEQKWKKLFDRLPQHENSTAHKNCYLAWRELERRLESDTGIDVMSHKVIMSETEKWRNILKRIIDVVIFLVQRGLAFCGLSQRIGDIHNGHFLGIIELQANYNPVLAEHLAKIRALQEKGERLQVHYLLGSSQIEFISNCTDYVQSHIFDEIRATNIIQSCPQRWAILKKHVGESIYTLPGTRWTDRVASVRPFAAHLAEIRLALKKLLSLNLTPKTINEDNSVIKYVSSFICILMSLMWLKILVQIDRRNQLIQARDATVDVEVSNLDSLLTDLEDLRGKWPQILNEAKLVAEGSKLNHLPSKRKVKKKSKTYCHRGG
ncbi:uncharacterized protein LOC106466641 [Limulus polyphemus]|uniref:Uncharacterized protein LOC106466641 n=1 Tax=Limulus polyphemus TaxID=6850 RepID=A0ABM1BHZ5_LIMPO|nr:uncharacterized protein LOC106466641 [Limulus polyphemus]